MKALIRIHNKHTIRLAAFICVVFVYTNLLATQPVRFLKLQPKFTASPARAFHVTVWVEHDALNRSLTLEATGADFYRSSAVQLDGEQAARAFEFWWNTFAPCGEYRWTATTFNQSGSVLARAINRSMVCTVPGGP